MRLLLHTLAILVALLPSLALSKPGAANETAAVPAKRAAGPEKYFHEPGGGHNLGHYDARYFKGKVPYEKHRQALRLLIKAYLTTFEKLGVETWLAHGTLLGWWWNGEIMPWDYDLDVQVSSATLYWLGQNVNRTEHVYTHFDDEDGGREVNKTYMLDINPHHIELGRENGRNIIDARWIDLENGMFIDITGLAERDGNTPGIWSCKNHHRYLTRDLYPMRISDFEGVRATVPYNFEKILIEEYGSKSLVTTSWLGHTWDSNVKKWVKTPEQMRKEEEERKKEEQKEKAEEIKRRKKEAESDASKKAKADEDKAAQKSTKLPLTETSPAKHESTKVEDVKAIVTKTVETKTEPPKVDRTDVANVQTEKSDTKDGEKAKSKD